MREQQTTPPTPTRPGNIANLRAWFDNWRFDTLPLPAKIGLLALAVVAGLVYMFG